MDNFLDIKNKIIKSKKIFITAHVNPDGDAVGAGLALLSGIEKFNSNCEVRFVLQDKTPDRVKFLELEKRAEIYDKNKKYDMDLAICVDSATLERIGEVEKAIKNIFTINIDHHISNPKYGDINYLENVSSTSEIIYKFLKFLDVEIDINIGEALYTGLVNDTGNFKHGNVTEETFKMAGYLVKIGVDNSKIVREFLNTKSIAAIKFLGQAMYEMKFDEKKKLAYFYLDNKDFMKNGGRKEDTEEIVENLISYEKAEVSLFLREDKVGIIKGSMRSKHDIDVNSIAGMFGGGGHLKASGFTSELSAEEIVRMILEKL
ncbi:bifunctional oligoribonuclease/PAP phosphatase NrnA [Fusobacterium sp.]|uniref:DHH family phosphoesterase n=1 Tax=Fusobacterium sp. TaxID=68766 RepID=UPI002901E4EC|nr:bifunctional oligoribonuclease/PAP phosphatase NrnA [Fusobacterium sp.]MDU1912347.1 bifunctional oligoribonuclease/PAP phosphatase NrnA [Fusobacterium sp.]